MGPSASSTKVWWEETKCDERDRLLSLNENPKVMNDAEEIFGAMRLAFQLKATLTVAVFIALNLGCLWIYRHYSRRDHEVSTSSILPYGVSAVQVLDRLGLKRRHPIEDRWWLILYFGEGYHRWAIPNLKYAQILYDRFYPRGLHVVGVVAGTFPEARRLAELGLITFPLMRDRDLAIARALGISPGLDACLFVDPYNTVRFSTVDFFDPEDLRQLTEKFLLGKVSHSSSAAEVRLREGEHLPDIKLVRINDWKLLQLGEIQSSRILIIFTAACPICHLDGYLDEYASIQHRWRVRPLAVFSQNFSRDEILFEARKRGIDTTHLYVAAEALGELEDPYHWSASGVAEVLVIEMDYDRTIKRIESWEEWMARWEGDTSP